MVSVTDALIAEAKRIESRAQDEHLQLQAKLEQIESDKLQVEAALHATHDKIKRALNLGMSRTLLKLEPRSLLVHHDIHDGGRQQV